MKRFWLRRGLRFFAFGMLFVGLAGLTIMALWNALLPAIMGVTAISFWQALGLLVLSRLLFGGFGRGGWRGGNGFGQGQANPRRANSRRHEWKQKMTERWQQMTPEQRDQMKQQWRSRCGPRGRPGRWSDSDPGPSDSEPKL